MTAHVRPCVQSYVRSCDGSGGYIYPTLPMLSSETELLPEMPPKNPKKMTKATGKVKAKGRKKKAPQDDDDAPDIPQPPSPIEEPEEPAEEREETDKAAEADGSSEDEEEDTAKSNFKVPQLTPEQEQELAEFYEENPLFYDKNRSDFKNTKKKDRLLQEKAEQIKVSGEYYSEYLF